LVMSAGLDGSGEAYLAKILDMGAGSFCDLVGAHPYAGSAKMADRRMAIMRRILAFHKVEKPLWITEVGWQSGGWKSGPGVVADEEVKARRLSDAYPLLQERADVVCWYVGVEPGRMYGLLQPTGSAGFTLNPAWFAMRDLAISRDLDISVECPGKAVAQAGEPMLLVARVRCAQPVQAQWCGIEPEWGRVESVGVSPGQPAEIALRFLVPEYARSGQRHLLLLVQDRQGSPIASHAVELSVENEGRVCDFSLGGGWIRKIEADGQEVGKWRPAHQLCPVPGEGFLQPLRPKNLGNFDDTLKLTVGGTAAKWLDDMPATVSVPAGKRGWVSLRVRVPAEAVPGTYTLEVRASSKAFPAVVREWRGVYSIVAPSGGK
ncbi:MAG: hypothetical protein KAI66_08870, partial [Lentisphaeria bacterium]|nr:hypothetical protein [Lentisphaeria bacterium]